MPLPIEAYALIGDNHTGALVGNDGSIDWLCLPRFDSPAVFAALLGSADNGRWRIAPAGEIRSVERRYRDCSLVLETTFETATGSVVVTDCMLGDTPEPRLVRSVRGLRGSVAMHATYRVRFDYGSIVPWVRKVDEGLLAVAGPDALLLAGDVAFEPANMHHEAAFTVAEGETVAFELTYFASHLTTPAARSPLSAIDSTDAAWREWSNRSKYDGPYRAQVERSLLTLKALTYEPTGGIVAAATTSLPETLGGVRNWDYRYCWLRDATFTLRALLGAGHVEAALAWRSWLLRAVAGVASDVQIVYSVRGSRRLPETELPWLAGYGGATPVRIGNDAHGQFQLDVFGEVVGLLHASHRFGIEQSEFEWSIASAFTAEVVKRWRNPDCGIWEVRGPLQHFTHSKVMAWVALDRAVDSIESFGMDGPLDEWRSVRDEIHAEVCAKAFDRKRNSFMQAYGSDELDAATLLLPVVHFLPPDDPRIAGTIAAIERGLVRDGLVYRYTTRPDAAVDGLPPGDNPFLACSFWLADAYALAGRVDDARALFERLCLLANDVGLLAEEYDPKADRQVGNFPQAFSHVGLVNTAMRLQALGVAVREPTASAR